MAPKKNLKVVLIEEGKLSEVCGIKEIKTSKGQIWFEHHFRSLEEIIGRHKPVQPKRQKTPDKEGICIHNGRKIFIEINNLAKTTPEQKQLFATIVKMTNALGALVEKNQARGC
jgi:hypothetical protein